MLLPFRKELTMVLFLGSQRCQCVFRIWLLTVLEVWYFRMERWPWNPVAHYFSSFTEGVPGQWDSHDLCLFRAWAWTRSLCLGQGPGWIQLESTGWLFSIPTCLCQPSGTMPHSHAVSDACGMQHMGAHERVVVWVGREPGTSFASFPELQIW